MGDEAAFKEMVKALEHIEKGIEEAESEELQGRIGRTFDHLTDSINQYIDESGEHNCKVLKHR